MCGKFARLSSFGKEELELFNIRNKIDLTALVLSVLGFVRSGLVLMFCT